MGTASFWAKDGFDAIAFLASAYVPGAAAGKLGSLTKVMGGFAKGKYLASALNKVKAATGLNTSTAISTVYNTISEAGFEGKEAYDTLKSEYAKKMGYASLEMAPPEVQELIKEKAGAGAARVFNWNLVALSAPNFIQSKIFHGSSKGDVRNLVDDVQVKGKSAVQLYKEHAESYLKNIPKGLVSEGL